MLYLMAAHRPLSQQKTFIMLDPTSPAASDAQPLLRDETLLAKDRVFIIRPDQQGITEMEASGKALWNHEFGTLVTTASIGKRFSAWGLLDGTVQILDESGHRFENLNVETKGILSAFPCIYATAISESGEYLAILYGRNPQHFAVFRRSGQAYALLFSQRLKNQVLSRQAAAFSADEASVLIKTADGAAFFDIEKNRYAMIHPDYFSGDSELEVLPFNAQGFVFLLARGDERFTGSIRRGSVEAFFPVDAAIRELSIDGDILTLRGGTSVQRYRLGGE